MDVKEIQEIKNELSFYKAWGSEAIDRLHFLEQYIKDVDKCFHTILEKLS
ncbi:MAG: hypothetical protein IJP69_03555 [Synergistaceae bacterium]|nr:hypothetical protein [Synergistaceae bacterium]MBR0252603.1 hypothetical protein [Synergistaceae bacterium]